MGDSSKKQSPIDVSEDGKVLKWMLKSNPDGERVVILGSTWVNITGKANGKEFLTGYDEEELEICLGRGSIAKGLELALADMRIGERCRVECHEGYGYGDRYLPKGLEGDEFPLEFEVEIRYSAKEFKGDEDTDYRIECAERKKARGNTLMKQKRLKTALKHYEHSLEISRLKEKVEPEQREKLDQLVLSSLLNLALVQLKLKNYQEVIKRCTSALLCDKKNCKAYFRRAQANRYMGDYFDAKEDILKCIKYMPDEQKKIGETELELIRKKEKKYKDKTKKMFGGAFKSDPAPGICTRMYNEMIGLYQSCTERCRKKELTFDFSQLGKPKAA